jgi:capsular exopolysaccharide synthesis family protein
MNMNLPDRHIAGRRALQVADEGRFSLAARAAMYEQGEFAGDVEQSSFTLRDAIDLVYRNRWFICTLTAISIVAGGIYTMLVTPKYKAEASVQINQPSARVMGTAEAEPTVDYQDADRQLKTQTEILASRGLAVRVAEREGLLKDQRFLEAMKVKLPNGAAAAGTATQRGAVISILQANLGVDLPRDSRVVTISFKSPDPATAARIANAFAKNFIISNLDQKAGSTSIALDSLRDQRAQAKVRLEASERKLNAYARSAGLIDTSLASENTRSAGTRSVTTASLVGLNEQYLAAKAERNRQQQRWNTANGSKSISSLPDVISNPVIQALRQDRATKQASLAERQKDLGANHPAVIQAQAELKEIDAQINSEAAAIRSSIRDDYNTAARQEQELSANVQGAKGATLSEQDRSVEYNILLREVETNRSLFEQLLQRYNELSAASNGLSNNLSIVDLADPPSSPSSPNLKLNLAAAAVLGIALALVIAFIRDLMDDAIRTPKDLEQKLGVPVLGAIPTPPRRKSFIGELMLPQSAVNEAYASLLVPLSYTTSHGMPRSLSVTSSQPGEGKTSSSLAIARGLARRGSRVLLIDADLRKPSLHKIMEVENNLGLGDVLSGSAALSEAIFETSEPRLHLLTSGTLPDAPTELISGAAFSNLLSDTVKDYDIVILDTPPVLGLADALILAAQVEATIFAVSARHSHARRITNSVRRLRDANARIIGTVLTKFDPSAAGLGSEYRQNYYSYGKSEL